MNPQSSSTAFESEMISGEKLVQSAATELAEKQVNAFSFDVTESSADLAGMSLSQEKADHQCPGAASITNAHDILSPTPSVKVIPYPLADTTVQEFFEFFLKVLGEGRRDKTLGIMKISGNDNSPVYILAISGTASNLFGCTTKLQKMITQQKNAWLKKKPKHLPICHIADTYSIYDSEGAPTADKVSSENRVLAAEKLSKFQNDVEKALEQGVLPETIAEKHQIGRNREKEMASFLKIMPRSENGAGWHDIVKNGVTTDVVEEWMNNTADLIMSTNAKVSSSLRAAWESQEPEMPEDVLTFYHNMGVNDIKNMSLWIFRGTASATASQIVWRKLLFPQQQDGTNQQTGSVEIVWGTDQYFVLACVVDFLQKCWCDDGLQHMTIGTGFLCCAEQNALEYAKRENLLRDKDFVQWTSAKICDTGLVDEKPCERCRVNFEPMVLCEMRSKK